MDLVGYGDYNKLKAFYHLIIAFNISKLLKFPTFKATKIMCLYPCKYHKQLLVLVAQFTNSDQQNIEGRLHASWQRIGLCLAREQVLIQPESWLCSYSSSHTNCSRFTHVFLPNSLIFPRFLALNSLCYFFSYALPIAFMCFSSMLVIFFPMYMCTHLS